MTDTEYSWQPRSHSTCVILVKQPNTHILSLPLDQQSQICGFTNPLQASHVTTLTSVNWSTNSRPNQVYPHLKKPAPIKTQV